MCYRDRTYCPFLDCVKVDCWRRLTDEIETAAARAGLALCLYADKPECWRGNESSN